MGSLRMAIENAPDVKIEKVTIPEWGGEFYIRDMSGADRGTYDYSMVTPEGKPRSNPLFRETLVVRCLCEKDGTRLFKNDEAALLGQKSSVVIDRLYEMCRKINGLGEAAKEEIAENFGKTQEQDSSTS